MVFTTEEGFLEIAIESWPEWNLNPQPLNSVQDSVQVPFTEFGYHNIKCCKKYRQGTKKLSEFLH